MRYMTGYLTLWLLHCQVAIKVLIVLMPTTKLEFTRPGRSNGPTRYTRKMKHCDIIQKPEAGMKIEKIATLRALICREMLLFGQMEHRCSSDSTHTTRMATATTWGTWAYIQPLSHFTRALETL